MRQDLRRFSVQTTGRGLTELTGPVRDFTAGSGIRTGLLTVFCRHTSASLLVQENADPTVRADLEAFLQRLVPDGAGYRHDAEGPDDMPSHIRTALTQTSVAIPIENGAPVLGTWQGIWLFEHRISPHRREVVLHAIGED